MLFKKKPERNQEAQALIDNFKVVFSSPEGMKVLDAILKKARYRQDLFTTDSIQNAYEQGKQGLAIWIMKQLEKE